MKNILCSLFTLVCVTNTFYSQTKSIEKGTYLTTNKGQKIKLNLLDNNKYEMVWYSGEYEIKGDSLLFEKKEKSADVFDLTYSKDKTLESKKIRVEILSDYSSLDGYGFFYIGTQNGTEDVVYQMLNSGSIYETTKEKRNAVIEIDRCDFIYLVYEDYMGSGNVSKYALPKDINNVIAKYSADIGADFNIKGYFDSKNNELILGDKTGQLPFIFKSEKLVNTPGLSSEITPLKAEIIPSWTYPGKAETAIYYESTLDSVNVNANTDYYSDNNLKLKVENNLKDAIAATQKFPKKFLVIYNDTKNTSAKADFDAFIKDKGNSYDLYNPEYDRFNFYFASKNDKKWLKDNKIESDPVVVILDSNGNLLATAQSAFIDVRQYFNYYDQLRVNLDRVNAFNTFKKVISAKKQNDDDLINAFGRVTSLDLPYDFYDSKDVEGLASAVDSVEIESAAEEKVMTEIQNLGEFNIEYAKLDKKQVEQIWNNLIVAHQKEVKPNMYLVEIILKEIRNEGFTKQFSNKNKILNDADFLAIDYLIKHAEAIEAERNEFNNKENEVHSVGNVSFEISKALSQNSSLKRNIYLGTEESNYDEKVISVYKKLIASGKGNYDLYSNYFEYLKSISLTGINEDYLKEFDAFFNRYLSSEKGNEFEQLDKLYSPLEEITGGYYPSWNGFKENCSRSCNESAWSVVEKPENNDFVKKAIIWSEYSLIISKNNAYYLDTLAQLYYKDGQKDKAIKAQKEAVKYSKGIGEETAIKIKEVLTKMENGTY